MLIQVPASVIPSTSDTVETNSNVKEKPSGSLVESITKEVKNLKVVPLRERLEALGLDKKGLKSVLQDLIDTDILALFFVS